MMNRIKKFLTSTATKLFCSGIIVLITAYELKPRLNDTLFDLLENLGIAILVSAFVSIFLETEAFITRIKDLIEDIVITKNFLRNLSTDNKKHPRCFDKTI